jgi:hypothetical protein
VAACVDDPQWDDDTFRQAVAQRLRSGAFVLVIVVDRMTDELERAANFVNACGRANFSFHVVEMQRFQTLEAEVLIPHVHGLTTSVAREPAATGVWPKDKFLEDIRARAAQDAPFAEDLYSWAETTADRVVPGRGTQLGSFSFHYVSGGRAIPLFAVYTDGRLEFHFDSVERKAGQEQAEAFYAAVHNIPGFGQIQRDFRRWQSVKLHEAFREPDSLARFKEAVANVRHSLP